MTKKLISFAVGLFACASVCVAGPDSFKYEFNDVATNGAASGVVTNSSVVTTMYIDMIVVDISGTATNVDIDIATKAGSGTGPSRTILTVDNMTADGVFYPRIFSVDDTSGGAKTQVEGTRIPLVSDVVQCWMQAEAASVTGRVWVILSTQP